MDILPSERDLMIRTIYGEADDQPPEGQAAVAHNILNRVNSGEYPDSIGGVIHQRNAYTSWIKPGKDANPRTLNPQNPEYQKIGKIVDGVTSGQIPDPTGGGLNFYAYKDIPPPSWAKGKQPTAVIGGHAFFNPITTAYTNEPQGSDLLGSWIANPTQQAQPTPSGEDLLGSWPAPAAAPSQSPAAVSPPTPSAPPPANESASDFIARQLTENLQTPGLQGTAIRAGLGTLRGIQDVAHTLGYGTAEAARAFGYGDWANTIEGRIAQARQKFEQAAAGSPAAQIGEIGGQVLGTLPATEAAAVGAAAPFVSPLARLFFGGTAAGGTAAGLTSAASTQPLGEQVAAGAIGGGALGVAGRVASGIGAGLRNALFGRVDPEVAKLADVMKQSVIDVLPAQMSSTYTTRLANSLMSRFPMLGYGKTLAAQQGGLNKFVAGEAGVSGNKLTLSARQKAEDTAYNDYDARKSNLGPLNVDNQFQTEIGNIANDASYYLEPAQRNIVFNHLRNLGNRLSTTAPGQNQLDADLFQQFTAKASPLQRTIDSNSQAAPFATEIKNALEGLAQRNDPMLKTLKDQADYKWFVLKSLEKGNTVSPTGDVNPTLLYNALDKTRTPVGQTAEAARYFMRPMGTSNTAEHLALMKLGGLAAAGLGASYFDPENLQRDLLLAGLGYGGARVASSLMRNPRIAGSMIRSGLGQAQPTGNFFMRAAPVPYLSYRNLNALSGQ